MPAAMPAATTALQPKEIPGGFEPALRRLAAADGTTRFLVVDFSASHACDRCERVEVFSEAGRRLLPTGRAAADKAETARILRAAGLRRWGEIGLYHAIALTSGQ